MRADIQHRNVDIEGIAPQAGNAPGSGGPGFVYPTAADLADIERLPPLYGARTLHDHRRVGVLPPVPTHGEERIARGYRRAVRSLTVAGIGLGLVAAACAVRYAQGGG